MYDIYDIYIYMIYILYIYIYDIYDMYDIYDIYIYIYLCIYIDEDEKPWLRKFNIVGELGHSGIFHHPIDMNFRRFPNLRWLLGFSHDLG